MLLIDERPEEVTEMKRSIRGEVVASSADQDSQSHVRLAQLVVERGKRLAEQGKQALVLLDSLTRLARAYNKNVGNSGRTMSGGIDIRALEVPKRLFGSARVFEEGGSLTVMGTALIETGSRMDDIIFQEFKGTGNMELVLDRKLSDRRIFPAMDITQSGTRKEERILPPEVLQRVTLLRRSLVSLNPVTAMESLVQQLGKVPSNAAFLEKIATFVR
jgi:transcription termination factor Rho